MGIPQIGSGILVHVCFFFFLRVSCLPYFRPGTPLISASAFLPAFHSWTSTSPPLKILPLIIISHRLWPQWSPMVAHPICLALLVLLANGIVPHQPRRSSVGGMETVGWCSRGASISLDTSGSSLILSADTCSYRPRVRKHTGERPFSCHCGKQFSRLDNLRQHAQTVHADKQDENEQMMRDLTTLHATMAAANKVGGSRGGRRAVPPVTTLHLGGSPGSVSPHQGTLNLIKQEDMSSMPMHQRPGTSTGYEGSEMYPWQNETESRRSNHHSFRDPGQSFLAPSSNSAAGTTAQSHSFRGYSGFSDNARPRSSSSRPPTSSGLADAHLRSLPPLAAVVSASLPSQPPQQHSAGVAPQQQLQQHQSQSVFSFPGSLALRRPSSSSRPGTAPASASSLFAQSKSAQYGMGRQQQPDLSLLHSGFGPGRSASSPFGSEQQQHFQLGAGSDGASTGTDPVPTSPSGHDASPFYFHPPDSATSSSSSSTSPPSVNNNPRKRAFGGPDGPYDHASSAPVREHQPPGSSSGLLLGLNLGGLSGPGAAPDGFSYDYGSESRPQSRRLTVMELCNDNEQRPPSSSAREQFVAGSGAFLLSAAAAAAAGGYGYGSGYGGGYGGYGSTSRPTTSSGLVSSASALHLFDRTSSPPSQPSPPQQHQFAHQQQHQQQQLGAGNGGVSPTTGGAGNGGAGAGVEASQEFRGGGVYPASFRVVQQQQSGGSGDAYAPVSPHPASSASHASTPTPPLLSPTTSTSSGHFASAQRSFQQQQPQSAYSTQYPQHASYPTSFSQQQFSQHLASSSHQQQQQHFHQHQQFAHSPTFSDASASSAGGHSPYSPRSPLSDAPPILRDARGDGGFRSPPHHLQQQQQQQQQFGGGGGHGHGGGQHAGMQQLDGQVRVTVSPYATSAFGMIF